MGATQTCAACGARWPGDNPLGQCPNCLLQIGLAGRGGTVAQDGAGSTPSTDKPAFVRRFAGYELLEQIGRGGQGVVYRARQVSLNRTVALKLLLHANSAEARALDRWRIEAETMARIHHPNIVPIHDFGQFEGETYLTMDLIAGESLARWIREQRFALPADRGKSHRAAAREIQVRIARLMVTVARAVHTAHQCGFLHRDLKPGNILMDEQGQPYVADFGLAKALDADQSRTRTGEVLGTAGYMSPEQTQGQKLGVGTDVYGLGAILYELLTGHPVFRGATLEETRRQVIESEPRPPRAASPWVETDLATICLKCLEKEAGRRYATAADLAEDLERWLAHKPVRARPAGPILRVRRWAWRNRMGTALILCLGLGLAIALELWRETDLAGKNTNAALGELIDTASERLDRFLDPIPPYLEVGSDTMRVMLGGQPLRDGVVQRRYIVGLLVAQRAPDTLFQHARLLASQEKALKRQMHLNIRVDLRFYRSEAALRHDLVAGLVHFAKVNPRLYLQAREENPALRPMVRLRHDQENAVIFSRPGGGITNLAALKGHRICIFDRDSALGQGALALLAQEGLSARDVDCSFPWQTCLSTNPAKCYREFCDEKGLHAKREVLEAVLERKTCDVGVATDGLLRTMTVGKQYVPLAQFSFPRHHWIAGSKVTPEEADAFQQEMLNAQGQAVWWDFLPEANSDGVPPHFQRSEEGDYATLRTTLDLASRFLNPPR